ncbi:hypothetical protein HPB50_026363 [Hyalomma asiaticum]|uniref:Uncharacterized protein n=1 Tax=Hyalomma asiaticum TaxID=266040 RepID=A0ACB7T9X6_HYAAI|nr:hypothetical protein HPB50_026363 [Hyalomma asiaticum]
MVRKGVQVSPSFANTWFTFFAVALILTPFTAVLAMILRGSCHSSTGRVNSASAVVIVFLSTYLGRSPPEDLRLTSMSMKIALGSWMMGMTVLLQFTQTQITASQSVPAYSSVIRHNDQLGVAFDAGKILPCMITALGDGVPFMAGNISYMLSMQRALARCGSECLVSSLYDCVPKAHRGTHAIVASCDEFLVDTSIRDGLVPGADNLVSFFFSSATHGNAPFSCPPSDDRISSKDSTTAKLATLETASGNSGNSKRLRTIPACVRCGTVGYRTDTCPNPDNDKCGLCGVRVPTTDGVKAPHECIPSCAVCGQAHAPNSRDCKGKFRQLKVSGPKAKRPKHPPIRLPNQTPSHPTSGANGGAPGGAHTADPKTPSPPAPSVTSAHGKKTASPPPPPSGKDTRHFPAPKTDGAGGSRALVPQHGKQVSSWAGVASSPLPHSSPSNVSALDAKYKKKKQIEVLRAQNELLLNKIQNLEPKLASAPSS